MVYTRHEMNRTRVETDKGFTIVELLIAIVVIAILTAVIRANDIGNDDMIWEKA